MQNYWWVRRK